MEDDQLLAIMLAVKLPTFWLPANNRGRDILYLAVQMKTRGCLKLILAKIIDAKRNHTLSPLPTQQDRFLRNLMRMTRDFDDIIGPFLEDFGLDDTDPKVGENCLQLPLESGVCASWAVGSQVWLLWLL